MNKKAQLFTLMTIAILTFLFLTFEIYSFINEKNSIKTRVSTMDSFLNSLEENMGRQLYIVGFRILFLAETQITSTGEYVDVDPFFEEAFFNGTVGGISNSEYLTGATYEDIVNSIKAKASKINVNVSVENASIKVFQTDPWNIRFEMDSDFIMSDKGELARWNKRQTIYADIPIVGLEDPFYTINSLARVSRKINRTIFEGNYVVEGNTSNLLEHIENNYYSADPNAPNFLGRMEGNFSANPQGIESFVNLPDFSRQNLNTKTKSVIDYIYFSSRSPDYYAVNGTPEWFFIDGEDNHLEKYNVSALIIP